MLDARAGRRSGLVSERRCDGSLGADAESRGERHEAAGLLLQLTFRDFARLGALQVGEPLFRVLDPFDQPALDGIAESVDGELDEVLTTLERCFAVDLRPVVLRVGEELDDGTVGRPDHSPIR